MNTVTRLLSIAVLCLCMYEVVWLCWHFRPNDPVAKISRGKNFSRSVVLAVCKRRGTTGLYVGLGWLLSQVGLNGEKSEGCLKEFGVIG